MNTTRRAMALTLIALSSAALTKDEVPRFKAGEWQIEVSQSGGASFKDSQSKRDDGMSRISQERPKQVATRCIKKKEAKLAPEVFAPGCTVTKVTYTGNKMEADLSCPNPSMTLTGSLSITMGADGKSMSGYQVLSGGGENVGATFYSNLEMKHMGKCKKK